VKLSLNENDNKKAKAYQNKLNEGLRLLDTLDLSTTANSSKRFY
jgi:hypothetical protein